MRADEHLRAVAQSLHVEPAIDMPRTVGFKRREQSRPPDAVAVDFAHGIEARMKAGIDLTQVGYPDCQRQIRIQGAHPGGVRPAHRLRHIKMRHLPQGMDACIGAAAAMNAQGNAREFEDRRLQHILHGVAAFLALPAAPWRAAVGHGETQAFETRRCATIQAELTFDVASAHRSTPGHRRSPATKSPQARAGC